MKRARICRSFPTVYMLLWAYIVLYSIIVTSSNDDLQPWSDRDLHPFADKQRCVQMDKTEGFSHSVFATWCLIHGNRRHVIQDFSQSALKSQQKSNSQASKSQVDLAFGDPGCIYRKFAKYMPEILCRRFRRLSFHHTSEIFRRQNPSE